MNICDLTILEKRPHRSSNENFYIAGNFHVFYTHNEKREIKNRQLLNSLRNVHKGHGLRSLGLAKCDSSNHENLKLRENLCLQFLTLW